MKRVLVTGPIGSGKSAACRYLSSLGYPVLDCDSLCKSLYDSVPGLKKRIEEALDIDFADICVIFTDAGKRETLESLVYPVLIGKIQEWTEIQTGPLIFIESALALSKPSLDCLYDSVLLVTADYDVRLARNPKVALRDSLQSFDLSRVNHTIYNNGDISVLHNLIDNYLRSL